ncbi:MAG TPA: ATP-dependent DNA helicase RecG [Methylomirabilota bacterium]|nr:ATP-dependent DNA helicase RecG [Methylomirabilota bacterium]
MTQARPPGRPPEAVADRSPAGPGVPAPAAPPGLDVPLQFLKGVGPQRARLLDRLGLHTVWDALNGLPRRYEDRRHVVPFRKLRVGEVQATGGAVVGVSPPPRGRPRVPLTVLFRDASGFFSGLWFNQPYLAQVFKRGQRVFLYGKVVQGRGRGPLTMQNPEFEIVEDDEEASLHVGRIVPVYALTEGLTQRPMRALLHRVVERYAGEAPDPLPEEVCRRRGLVPAAEAYRVIHFPDSLDAAEAARRRFVFEDFLLLQLGLAIRRRREAARPGHAIAPPGALVAGLLRTLPFALTAAQRRVWEEIRADLARPTPMNRLLQGDVGSGKTIVAVMALLTAVEAGFQGVLMAPTEILAEQHFATVRALLEPLGVPLVLLTSGQKAKEREAALAATASGAAPVVVGTHALIQEAVAFHRLGLAVVDEQHRFGVLQRAALRAKGQHPDVLVMTATPIPRTLALTLYGDLDVSVLDELPPGRQRITTAWRSEAKRGEIYAFIRKELDQGRQAYVVYPLVEETEASDLRAATKMAEHLAGDVFPDRRVGLIHGRLGLEAKDAVMRAFKAGELDVLVATTVIEVGIDVPNASVMLIEHAERFGLAQLHQLRGRVGRGSARSYCVLLASALLSDEAQRRLQAMCETQDGFKIAEVDLEIRGPGEFFGTRQAGLPEFRAANLLTDGRLLEEARQEALALVERDPGLRAPDHRPLRDALVTRWREKLDLASVG